jgi:hypothetical protein
MLMLEAAAFMPRLAHWLLDSRRRGVSLACAFGSIDTMRTPIMTTSRPPSKFGVVSMATATQTDGLTFLCNMITRYSPAPPFAETSDISLIMASTGEFVRSLARREILESPRYNSWRLDFDIAR